MSNHRSKSFKPLESSTTSMGRSRIAAPSTMKSRYTSSTPTVPMEMSPSRVPSRPGTPEKPYGVVHPPGVMPPMEESRQSDHESRKMPEFEFRHRPDHEYRQKPDYNTRHESEGVSGIADGVTSHDHEVVTRHETEGVSGLADGVTRHDSEGENRLKPRVYSMPLHNYDVIDSQMKHRSWIRSDKSIETTVNVNPEATLANADYDHSVFDIFQIDDVNSVDVEPQVIAVGVAPYQGKPPGPYVPTSEWRIWLKRLENFMKLRNVSDDSKKFVFLDEIGDVNYGILEGLLPGKELEEYTYEQLKDAMTARFQPKTLVMSERFKLTQLTQKSTQNLAEFLTELQSAARSCEFDKITDIRDAFIALEFISGVRSDDTRKKLIEQTSNDSSQLLALAEAHERAGRGASELHRTGLDTVQAVRGRMGEHPHHRTRNSSTGHNHREHNRGKTQQRLFCHICKYIGHSTDDCRYNGLNDESANVVSEDEASLYEYDIDHIEVHAVDLIPEKAPPKCLIEALIDTTPIEFELDTGSGVSVVGYQTWEALSRPNLQETHRAAKAYGGQLLRFRGVLQTEVSWGSKKILTRLFVLNSSSPSVWGRESIQRFDMDLGPVYRNGIQRAEEVKGVLSGTDHPTPNRA